MRNKMYNVLATLLFVGAFGAWGKGNLQLKNEAFKEQEELGAKGKPTGKKKLVPAEKVAPGEEVIFVITYRNGGKEPATEVVITNPIPKNMLYRSASADKKGVTAEVSVDGGKKFGKLELLKVLAEKKERTALPDDVTHIRWKMIAAVKPNEEGKVRFKALLK